jgi:hypothetical protein
MILLWRDALHIVSTVKAKHKNYSQFGHIVVGIQIHMRLLRLCMIEHIKSDANSMAQGLAKEAVKHVKYSVWIEEISNCIYDIVGVH